MYRDSANALDEHDRAVGAILISEALIDVCEDARNAIKNTTVERNERWRTLTSVHDTYPEVWRHLDRARKELASRGANTASYDELRPHARRAPTNADGTEISKDALDDARCAVENLKLAVPGADWKAIRARTAGLVRAKLTRPRGQRTMLLTVLALVVTAMLASLIAIVPERKISRRAAMRAELSQVAEQRKMKIMWTRIELGGACDVERARELVKLLVLDGQTAEARATGLDYMARCGDDATVDNWTHAPAPRSY